MPASEPLVLISPRSRRLAPPALEDFARSLRERVTGGRGFHCLITDDRELRRLNRQFLGKRLRRPMCCRFRRGERGNGWHVTGRDGDFRRARRRAGARVRPFGRGRNPHPDAAWRAASAGHGSRTRPRRHGPRRSRLAQEARAARRLDRTGAAHELCSVRR